MLTPSKSQLSGESEGDDGVYKVDTDDNDRDNDGVDDIGDNVDTDEDDDGDDDGDGG